MGNVPAKITGKYQSYDINNSDQFTPTMPTMPRVRQNTGGSQETARSHNDFDNNKVIVNSQDTESTDAQEIQDIVKRNLENKSSISSNISEKNYKSDNNDHEGKILFHY